MDNLLSWALGVALPALIVFLLEKFAPGSAVKLINKFLSSTIKQKGAVNKIENAVALKTMDLGFEMYTCTPDAPEEIDSALTSLEDKKQKLLALKVAAGENPS